jgi:hypothetical protein
MAFSMRKYGGPGLKYKVLARTAKLFVVGLLTQGVDIFDGGGIDLHNIRIPGILQRIAWAYCIVSLMKMWLPVYTTHGFRYPWDGGRWEDAPPGKWSIFQHYSLHWATAFFFVFVYACIMLFAHVPSWEWEARAEGFDLDEDEPCGDCDRDGNKTAGTYVRVCTAEWQKEDIKHVDCDTYGDLTPKCSAARMVDVWVLGWNHMCDFTATLASHAFCRLGLTDCVRQQDRCGFEMKCAVALLQVR